VQAPPAGFTAQAPLVHLPVQQSVEAPQVAPVSEQAAQLPARQMFEQHWLASVQLVRSA
jgi:hypothetical protein